ncbi:LysR family transcriptional regulator (plasmid) [Deinococcus aetherius]|uniref:LysR family transcriptional regulator n=1 Tax=Deinococcus aetherius TaxID=200252 RepID=A0ABM8AK61_9DEIO|nr:LysR family transcriptional regulator [Deinococcus aetherius]BDP44107.1 LysR family transcriptional regulator [Deinococcus aetherius]
MADGGPTLTHLRVFLAVVRTGSFSTAAVELDLTQSGVSHNVKQLEQLLGVALLHRGAGGARPTSGGLRVAELAQQMLELAGQLPAAARAEVPLNGLVRIASFPSLAGQLLPGVVARMRELHPGVEVQVQDAYLERDAVDAAVLTLQADVGLTQLPAHPRLLPTPIGEDPYDLLLPRGWEEAGVWNRPYIHLGSAREDFVLRALGRAGVQLRPALTLTTEGAILAMVARGLGFSVLPRLALGELPPGVRRAALPLPLARTLGTVHRPGALTPATRAVLGLLWESRLLSQG